MRTLCKKGARGPVVWELQRALAANGVEIDIDGVYGAQTERALAPSGVCDFDRWVAVTGRAVPPAAQRALQLTAAFEAHGFTKVAGNFDGAGLTWGLVGFTLKFGMVQQILKEIHKKHRELFEKAFGELAPRIEKLAKESLERQMLFADEISVPPRKTSISALWQQGFEALGALPEVQAIQMQVAEAEYLAPAIATWKSLGLKSEQSLALCLDIQVQNGGVKSTTRAEVRAAVDAKKPELAVRKLLATRVADSAKPRWRDDVLSRKMTLATGLGKVHGESFVTADWGVGDFPVE